MQQNEKVDGIVSDILEQGKKRAADIETESSGTLGAELAEAEAEAKAEAKHRVKKGKEAARQKAGKSITEAEINARKELFAKRSEIAEKTFGEVKSRVEKFTQTDEYKEFLIRSAKKIYSEIGECNKIIIREQDSGYAKDIAVLLGKSVTVKTDNSIKLGGFIAFSSDGKTVVDDTLDERISGQKTWFIQNSGLDVI